MKKTALLVLATAAMMASLSSCYIRISDEARKSLREMKAVDIVRKDLDSIRYDCNPFYKVVTTASLDTRILHTDGEPRAIVIGSTNLRDSVTVENNDGVLVIDIKGRFYNSQDERVIVYATDWLNAAATEGSGDISIGYDSNGKMLDEVYHFSSLSLLTEGSGDIILGNIFVEDSFSCESLGSGDIHCRDLKAKDATISTRGSGDLYCKVLKAKDATISTRGSGDASIDDCDTENLTLSTYGSGDLEVAGKTQNASLKTYGSGDIDVSNLSIEQTTETKKLGSGKIKGRAVKDLKK